MLVHPGEMIVDPGGRISMTPDAPETLAFGKKGTRIIPAHEVNQMMLSGIVRERSMQVDNSKDIRELKEALQEIGYAQLTALKKKQVIHKHIHFNPRFQNHLKDAL